MAHVELVDVVDVDAIEAGQAQDASRVAHFAESAYPAEMVFQRKSFLDCFAECFVRDGSNVVWRVLGVELSQRRATFSCMELSLMWRGLVLGKTGVMSGILHIFSSGFVIGRRLCFGTPAAAKSPECRLSDETEAKDAKWERSWTGSLQKRVSILDRIKFAKRPPEMPTWVR